VKAFAAAEVPATFAALGVLATAATHLECQGALAVVIFTVHSDRCFVAPLAGEALAAEAAAALREDKYLSDGSKPRLYMFSLTSLMDIAPASLLTDCLSPGSSLPGSTFPVSTDSWKELRPTIFTCFSFSCVLIGDILWMCLLPPRSRRSGVLGNFAFPISTPALDATTLMFVSAFAFPPPLL